MLVVLPNRRKLGRNHIITFLALVCALVANFINLYLFTSNNSLFLDVTPSWLSYEPFSYWIVEIFLFVEIIFYISGLQNMKRSHSRPLLDFIFLMFTIGVIGMVTTINLAVIYIFLLWTQASLYYLFFFGSYRKKTQIVESYKRVFVISAIILIGTIVFLYFIAGTLNLLELQSIYSEFSGDIQLIVFIGLILGLGLSCGIFPILTFHLSSYYQESNSMHMCLYSTIFVPVLAFITLRILSIFTPLNSTLNLIILLSAGISGSYFLLVTFYRLFKKNQPDDRWIYPLIGNYSSLEYFVFLLIGSYLPSLQSAIVTPINPLLFNMLLLSIVGKAIIFEALNPILNHFETTDTRKVSGLFKTYPYHAILLCIIPLILFSPYLSGYQVILGNLNLFLNQSNPLFYSPFLSWSSFGIICGYFLVLVLILGKIIAECYMGINKNNGEGAFQKPSSIAYWTPVLLIGYLIILFIFVQQT